MTTPSNPLRSARIDATPELLAAFAAFHEAAPWQRFDVEDWIRIEGDRVPPGLAWAVVGRDEGMPFLTLVESVESFMAADREMRDAALEERAPHPMHAGWALSCIDRADPAEPPDVPSLLPMSTDPESAPPPTKEEMRHVARVLVALADAEDAEIDAGRFARRLESEDGAVELAFELPDVVAAHELPDDALVDDDPEAETPYERFVDLPGRARRIVARRLVDGGLAPIDGQLLLADLATDDDEARERCRAARDAAEATLAAEGDAADAHARLGLLRALGHLATLCRRAGEIEDVRTAWERSVALDDSDPFATGLELALALLETDRDAESNALLDDARLVLHDDESMWLQTIVAYRLEGDAPETRRLLRDAEEACPDLAALVAAMLDEDEMLLDDRLDALDPDDPVADLFLRLETILADTPGLADWIVSTIEDGPRHTPKQRKRRSR